MTLQTPTLKNRRDRGLKERAIARASGKRVLSANRQDSDQSEQNVTK
jgi:hypothetical protein